MFRRSSGFSGIEELLGSGRKLLNDLRGKPTTIEQVAQAAEQVIADPEPEAELGRAIEPTEPQVGEDGYVSPNTPPGAADGMEQHAPGAKPAPNVPQFADTTSPSVYQRILAEWKKVCDPETGFEHFCKNYVWINNQFHGYMHFKLYDYQKRTAKMLATNRFVITKKFRQAGMSLLTGVYCLWYALTHPRMQVMVISIGQRESTKYLQENVKEVYYSLPKWLKGGLNDKGLPIKWDKAKAPKDSASELWLPNLSKIRSIPSGKAGGRGFATKILVIDEAAFIENIDAIWTGIFPTISNTKGSVFVVSTVNGVGGTGGWYYHKYKEALAGENDFVVAPMEWTEHPDYNNEEWSAGMLRQLGQRKWDQEVLGKFLASGNTYISSEHIEKMERQADLWQVEDKANNRPEMMYGGKLLIWKDFVGERPNPRWKPATDDRVRREGPRPDARAMDEEPRTLPAHRYAIGADPATAGGLDNSCFHVVDVTTGEQVAEFMGKVPEDKFAMILAYAGYRYGTAVIAVEVNGTAGGATLVSLDKIQRYKRIYHDPNGKMGWTTTSRTRNTMIADLESGLYDDSWKIRSHRLIDELKTFIVTKTGRIEADVNSHDDDIMAWLITTADDVIRAARRAAPKQPEAVLLVNEPGTNGEDDNIVSRPVYSSAQQLKDKKVQRADLLTGTKHGEFLEKMSDLNEIAGDDVLTWLFEPAAPKV